MSACHNVLVNPELPVRGSGCHRVIEKLNDGVRLRTIRVEVFG